MNYDAPSKRDELNMNILFAHLVKETGQDA